MSEQIQTIQLAEICAYAEAEIRNGQEEPTVLSTELVEGALRMSSELLHEDWRQGIRDGFIKDGKPADTERMRTSKNGDLDEAWYLAKEAEGVVFQKDATTGKRLVNTNLPYDLLSPSWQNANIDAAKFAVGGVVYAIEMGVDVSSYDFVEAMAAEIHEKWMADNNNEWGRNTGNDHLFTDFGNLTPTEQDKDRAQVTVVLKALGYSFSTIPEAPASPISGPAIQS